MREVVCIIMLVELCYCIAPAFTFTIFYHFYHLITFYYSFSFFFSPARLR